MKTVAKGKGLDPKKLYTGQTLTYKGQKVRVIEVEAEYSGKVCIELPNGGGTLWVSPTTLSL